jgi:hypothetical protein
LVVSLDGYRYDSVGEDRAWNGKWESAVSATGDRWFLEVKIPAQDLGMERTAPAEDWRLNLCVNQERGCLTWAAVGPAFHNPNGFGKLVTQEFATWRDEQPAVRARRKAEILQAAGANSARYAERLAAIENTADSVEGGGARGEVKNWQEITRAYAQTDYIGSAYRCVADEVRYRKFFE